MVWKSFNLFRCFTVGMILGLSSLLLYCSGAREADKKNLQKENQPAGYDESFDPLTLHDDDLQFTADSTRALITAADRKDSSTVAVDAVQETEGFRVQILATNNIETASLTEQEATARFASLKVKIYLIFEAPLYKIRVGDCTDRNSAEDLRDRAKDLGYGGAFIVKTRINQTN